MQAGIFPPPKIKLCLYVSIYKQLIFRKNIPRASCISRDLYEYLPILFYSGGMLP